MADSEHHTAASDGVEHWDRMAARARACGYSLMTTAELDRLMREDAHALVVGTMSPEDFDKDHIPGSVNFTLENSPLSRLFKRKPFRTFLGPDPDRVLVFYCIRPSCANCHSAALLAVRLGFRRVYRYPAGVVGWMRSGRPAAGSMHPES